jgi:hypothetical protein
MVALGDGCAGALEVLSGRSQSSRPNGRKRMPSPWCSFANCDLGEARAGSGAGAGVIDGVKEPARVRAPVSEAGEFLFRQRIFSPAGDSA